MDNALATLNMEYEMAKLARATQRTQLGILTEPDKEPTSYLPYCARTGPFFDWATRSCSDEWLLEVAYPPLPAARRPRSRRAPQHEASADYERNQACA